MTLDDIPNILKALPDSDCTPNIVFFPRQFKAPRTSAEVLGSVLYTPTNPEPINKILEARTQRATKRVLKPISSGVIETVWIATADLVAKQAFLLGEKDDEKVKMVVVSKTADPRNPGHFWILTNHPALPSFHTSQIEKVKVAKIAPKPEAPVLVSIGKRIVDLTPEDFQTNNLPTEAEAVAMWNAEVINTNQYRAISRAIRLHHDPEMFLSIEAEAAKLA